MSEEATRAETPVLRLRPEHATPPSGLPAPRRRTWWVAFSVLTLLGCWWSFASPLFSLPDEPAHATYAAGVVRGELYQEAESVVGRYVTVPADFADAGVVIQCFAFQPNVPAGCADGYGVDGDALAEVATTAGRYPPAYYAVAGLPSLVLDGAPAVYAMRLLTAAMTAALLASAVVSAFAGARTLWPVLGVVTATTPMVLFFSGGVNPQAPEIAAGTLLWSAGLALLDRTLPVSDDPVRVAGRTRLVLRVCVAAAVLAVVRPIAPLWLALVVVLLVVGVARRDDIVSLLRRRDMLVGNGAVALLGVSTVVWVLTSDALAQQQVPTYADLPVERAVLISAQDWDGDLFQMVGVFGWLDTNPPAFVHYAWLAVVGALAVLAAAATRWRARVTLLVLTGLGLALPVLLEVQAYRESAFAWQGRYILPLLVGVPVLAGHLLDRDDARLPRRLVAVMVWVLVVCHVGAFVGVLNRYLRGIDAFWYLDPAGWDPPLPVAVLVLGYAATLVVGAVLVLHRQLVGPEDEPQLAPSPPGSLT